MAPADPAPARRASPIPAPETADLRVATYNILAGKLGLDGVVTALRSFDADLIALQEVDRRTRRSGHVDQPRVLADALGMHVGFATHRRYGGGEIGVALLSKHPLSEVETLELPGGELSALQAEVVVADAPVRVFVVHFHPTDPRDPPARQARMDAMRRREAEAVLLHATARRGPTIVLGDFNARSSGPEYGMFSDHLTDACPDGRATWPASLPLVRIDYVWTSPQLARVACLDLAPAASDHRPVVADLQLVAR